MTGRRLGGRLTILALPFTALMAVRHPFHGAEPPVTVSVDPCRFATRDQLRLVVASGMAARFPMDTTVEGLHVTLVDPEVRSATCPQLELRLRASLRYAESRENPPSTGSRSNAATVTVEVAAVASVSYRAANDRARVNTGNLERADVCVRRINAVEMTAARPGRLLDEAWITRWLAPRFAQEFCFPATSLLFVFLERGGML